MAESSSCTKAWRCGAVTPGVVPACPACGAKTISSNRIRILGWVLIAIGVFLAGLMGYLTVILSPTLSRPGVDMGGLGRWSGTADQAGAVLNLFYAIIALGCWSIFVGISQIKTGRRHRVLMIASLVGAAIVGLLAYEANTLLKMEEEPPPRIVQPPPMPSLPSPDKPQ